MANTVRIKRRAAGGAAGAPATLLNAELAFNEQDNTLYYGFGTGGAEGTATAVVPIAGAGAFMGLVGDQTINGSKTFTSLIQGSVSGNAGTATKLQTARTINGISFDGSGNITITANTPNTLSAGSYLIGTAFNGGAAVTWAVDATAAATANKVVARDASGNFAANSITAALVGNASTASALQTGRTIAVTGDATWSVTFDGATNVTNTLTLASIGTAGTYTKVTTDSKGRVVSGGPLLAADIPTILASKISDFDTQVRTNRLDQMGAPTTAVAFNSQRLTNLADPVSPQDAATKNYVDMTVQGLDPKQSVRAATTAHIASMLGTMTVDGVALSVGNRVLVKDQNIAAENGIYVVQVGTWVRAADANAWDELPGAYLFVEEGTTNADMGFVCTVETGGTLGTTAVTFQQFNGAGQVIAGAGMTKTGNQLDIGAGTGISVAADAVSLAGQALALHNLSVNGIFVRTSAGAVAARSIAAGTAGVSITNGDGVAGDPTINLSASLFSIGGLTPVADRLPYFTGSNTAALATITSFARSLLDDGDAATMRSTLALGTMATQNNSAVAITGGSITNLSTFDGVTIDCGTY